MKWNEDFVTQYPIISFNLLSNTCVFFNLVVISASPSPSKWFIFLYYSLLQANGTNSIWNQHFNIFAGVVQKKIDHFQEFTCLSILLEKQKNLFFLSPEWTDLIITKTILIAQGTPCLPTTFFQSTLFDTMLWHLMASNTIPWHAILQKTFKVCYTIQLYATTCTYFFN